MPEFNTVEGNTSEYNAAGPESTSGSPRTYFSALVVGFSVGVNQFTITDGRVRGGGLAPEFQTIEQSRNMWDLGYWDGKPYPLGGGLVVMLPSSLLSRFSREDIETRIQAIIPMGTVAVIRYFDEQGVESV